MRTKLFDFEPDCELYAVTDSIHSEEQYVFIDESPRRTTLLCADSMSVDSMSVDSDEFNTDELIHSLEETVVDNKLHSQFTVESVSVEYDTKTQLTMHGYIHTDHISLSGTIVLQLDNRENMW